MKNYRSKIQIMLYATLIVLGISALFYGIMAFVDKQLKEAALDTLGKTSVEQQTLINTNIDMARDDILSVTNAMAFFELTQDTIPEYLNQQMKHLSFTSIYYTDIKKDGIAENSNFEAFSNKISVDTLEKNEVLITYPYISESTGKYVLGFQASVYQDNQEVGVIFAEYPLEPLTALITDEIGMVGYAVITDGEGNDFYSTDPEFVPLEELGDALLENGITLESIREDLRKQESGTVTFALDNISRVAIHTPLNINDWSLVLVVDEDQIIRDSKMVSTMVILFIFCLVGGIVLFVWYTWKTRKEIEKAAYYDELTELPNLLKLKKHMVRVLREGNMENYAVIKMDVTNFKTINEMFNYKIGNDFLKAIAKASKMVLDSKFMMARTGADEFMMFTSKEFAKNIAQEKVVYELAVLNAVPELKNHKVSFRYGRYFIVKKESSINDIINKVSLAHNFAKQRSEKDVWDYDENYKKQVLIEAELTNKMNPALTNGEFVMFLQSKVRLEDNRVIGAEALVRWIEADGKMIYPDVFIPLFERNGFVVDIDKCILASVCKTIRRWLDEGNKCIPVAVNFSRLHMNNPNFVQDIIRIVDEYNVPRKYIEIELTESTVLDNSKTLETLLGDLHSAGFKVSIDDFGAGYSSLGMLKNFKVDTLKLDRSFLMDDRKDGRGHMVIEGIVALAHGLNMTVVAEGVEDLDQAEYLKSISCDYVQGYYFAKPIPVDKFEEEQLPNS